MISLPEKSNLRTSINYSLLNAKIFGSLQWVLPLTFRAILLSNPPTYDIYG